MMEYNSPICLTGFQIEILEAFLDNGYAYFARDIRGNLRSYKHYPQEAKEGRSFRDYLYIPKPIDIFPFIKAGCGTAFNIAEALDRHKEIEPDDYELFYKYGNCQGETGQL